MPQGFFSGGCTTPKRPHYAHGKSRRAHPNRLELKKYCRWCKKHPPHRETKWRPRVVALTARAPDSKSGGWGFESLHPCHFVRGREAMGIVTRIREFVQEVLAEFRKVTWPSRQELINSTTIVIVVTVVLAFFLGGVDIALSKVVERILR